MNSYCRAKKGTGRQTIDRFAGLDRKSSRRIPVATLKKRSWFVMDIAAGIPRGYRYAGNGFRRQKKPANRTPVFRAVAALTKPSSEVESDVRAASRSDGTVLCHGFCNRERRSGEIGRRARLGIAKSSLSKHRFSFQNERFYERRMSFLVKSRNATNGEQKGSHSSTNSSTHCACSRECCPNRGSSDGLPVRRVRGLMNAGPMGYEPRCLVSSTREATRVEERPKTVGRRNLSNLRQNCTCWLISRISRKIVGLSTS
jgi:hypothetical protein